MRAQEPSLLAGLLHDGHGRRMSPSHANKAGKRYRYYRSQMESKPCSEPCWRVSAPDVETRACAMLGRAVGEALAERIALGDLSGGTIKRLKQKAAEAEKALTIASPTNRSIFLNLVPSITIGEGTISMDMTLAAFDPAWADTPPCRTTAPLNFVRSGDQVKLIIPAATTQPPPNPHLIKVIAQAFAARREIEAGTALGDVAQRHSYSIQYAADLVRVSYLSPALIAAILEGSQPTTLTRRDLVRAPRLPLGWQEQEQLFAA